MSTSYPTSLDALINPTATSKLNAPSHSAQHINANDAIEALQAKLGTGAAGQTAASGHVLVGTDTGATQFRALLVTDLSGLTASVTELNYTDGVTSAIQTQLDTKLANVVEDTTPQLGGELDAQANNIIDLADVTFKTGATGGTLRTGTSAADKFELQAYDVNGGFYQKVLEVDAGNTPTLEVFADSFMIWDNTDETKTLKFTLSGGTTGVTTNIAHSPTANRTITFPDATDTLVGRATADTLTNKTLTSPNINEAVALTATSTELNHVDGVTSAIQTQLDAKAEDDEVVHLTGAETIGGAKTFSSDINLGGNTLTNLDGITGWTSSVFYIDEKRASGLDAIAIRTDNAAGTLTERLKIRRGANTVDMFLNSVTLKMSNNHFISAAESGGTYRALIGMDGANKILYGTSTNTTQFIASTDIEMNVNSTDVASFSTTYALQLPQTGGTAAEGITFGTDTNLYRSAADTLATDDIVDFRGTMGNSTKTVGTDAPADWVEVKIAGTTYYLPAYAA